jgi:hypothetical protein
VANAVREATPCYEQMISISYLPVAPSWAELERLCQRIVEDRQKWQDRDPPITGASTHDLENGVMVTAPSGVDAETAENVLRKAYGTFVIRVFASTAWPTSHGEGRLS